MIRSEIQSGALVVGLAQRMHDLGIATYTDPTESIPATTPHPAVFFGSLGSKPDQAVAVTPYNTDPDIQLAETPIHYIQLRWRAATYLAVTRLRDDSYSALQQPEITDTWPGGVHPLWMVRTTGIPSPERDDSGRWTAVENYQIALNPGE